MKNKCWNQFITSDPWSPFECGESELNGTCNGDRKSSTVRWRRHACTNFNRSPKKAHTHRKPMSSGHTTRSPLDHSKLSLLWQTKIFVRPFKVDSFLFSNDSNDVKVWCECMRLFFKKKKTQRISQISIHAKQNTCKIGKHWFPDWGQPFSQFIRWLGSADLSEMRCVCNDFLLLLFHRFRLIWLHHHQFCCWNNQSILHIWHENCGNELIVPLWLNLWTWCVWFGPVRVTLNLFARCLFTRANDEHVKVIAHSHSQFPFVFPQLSLPHCNYSVSVRICYSFTTALYRYVFLFFISI